MTGRCGAGGGPIAVNLQPRASDEKDAVWPWVPVPASLLAVCGSLGHTSLSLRPHLHKNADERTQQAVKIASCPASDECSITAN